MSILKKLSLEDEMLQYLQKKYGKEEPFKILGTDCQSMFSKSHESKAISERFPDDVITIIKYKHHGKTHIKDNFIEISKRDELSQAYADLIQGIYPKYKVILHALRPSVTVLPEDIDTHTEIDKIIHHKELTRAIIFINVEDDAYKKLEKLEQIKNIIYKNIKGLSIGIAYCMDVNDIKTKYMSMYSIIDDDFDLSKVEWEIF